MKRILVLFVAATFLGPLSNGPVLAEDTKEAAKKEVESKPLELPKGLKGISVGGTYFLEYYNKDYEDDTKNDDFSSFTVQRAYITLKKKFTPWFSSRVTADITYDSKRGAVGADAKEIGWEFRLKYAYGKFDVKKLGRSDVRLESEFGLVHCVSDDYDTALWPYRAQGKHFLDRHSIMSSADYGTNVRLTFGDMDKEFKKKVSKKYAGKWGGIWAGVYNGAGYGHKEENDDKAFEVLAYMRPFNMIDLLKGLRIGYHALRGESDTLLTGGGPKEYPEWEIDQFLASYQHEYFTVMGQWYSGKSEDRSSDNNDRDGYNIAAFVKMPFHKKLRIFARYDVYDKDNNRDNYDENTKIYGVSYDLDKGIMAWAGLEDKEYDSGLNKNDYKLTQVGLAIKL
ncbi:MAG: hypothetical protein IMF20_02250 [Proteobacteria bacterium]|nr:hypothetical protein [Pseudomonadota bacterium]